MNKTKKTGIMIFSLFFLFALLAMAKGASAANWYVDNTASGSNNGSSWSNAWNSFSRIVWGASGVKAGDTLYISGGSASKTYASGLAVGASGSGESSRITIKVGQEAGHNGTVIISSGGIDIGNSGYITIDGEYSGNRRIDVRGGGLSANGASYFSIRYISIGNVATGIDAPYGIGGRISYCYLYNIGTNSDDSRGMVFAARNSGGSAYDLTFVDHCDININRNPNSGNGPDGIQGGTGLTLEKNIIRTTAQAPNTGTQHQDLVQMQAQYITIRDNTFINSGDSMIDYDVFNGQPHHHRIYNNTFLMGANGNAGIRYYSSSDSWTTLQNIFIANNTFVDHVGSGQNALRIENWAGGNPVLTNVVVQNNIFFNNAEPVYIAASSGFTAADWHFDYNLIGAGPHGDTRVTIDNSTYTQSHSRSGSPLFANYMENGESSDLHLMANDTAARNMGIDLSGLFATDKDGYPRTGTWDIGAFEYASGESDTTPPAAPRNVKVN
jgi:hypothetical protein